MARTHKERHKWKNKERKKTGKSDPAKVALHRQRFLERLEQKALVQNGYSSMVFQARLRFNVEEGITQVFLKGEKIGELPYLVEDVSACHYLLATQRNDFNASLEAELLLEHVHKAKFLEQKCHCSKTFGGEQICCSVVACRYRHWNNEKQLPECHIFG